MEYRSPSDDRLETSLAVGSLLALLALWLLLPLMVPSDGPGTATPRTHVSSGR
ncbi:MAG: hypothetical protein AAFX50_04585 [Acidobacteriota bacterium]